MADERALAQEDQWWAFDADPDSQSPASSFDEPVQWPDSLPIAAEAEAAALPTPPPPPPPPPDAPGEGPDDTWQAALDLSYLEGDAAPGEAGSSADDDLDLHLGPLPESLWAADPVAPEELLDAGPAASAPDPAVPPEAPRDEPLVVTGALVEPAVYAESEQRPPGWRPQWPDLRHGNAAMVALISFVSLVLLGMFLSVRARNDISTDTSGSRPSGGQIAARNLNTIPTPTTAATTTTAPPAIALTDLLPPPDGSGDAAAQPGTGGGTSGGGGAARPSAPTATAAPGRSAAPTGSGSGTRTGTGSGGGSEAAPPAAAGPPSTPPADQQTGTPPPSNTLPPDTPSTDTSSTDTSSTDPSPPVDDTPLPPPQTTPTDTPDTDIVVPDVTAPAEPDRSGFRWPSGMQRPSRDD